jgi:hypothetical protein
MTKFRKGNNLCLCGCPESYHYWMDSNSPDIFLFLTKIQGSVVRAQQ